jgi:hypothetical protein
MISRSINNFEKATIINIPDVFTILSRKKTVIILNKSFTIALIELFLVCLCILSDYLVFKDEKFKNFINSKTGIRVKYIHVILDNGSHSLIGLLSYLIFSIPNISLLNLFLSAFISSFIDIDHFISAKSFKLDDAVSLPNRPFMHNTAILLTINLIISLYFIIYKPKLHYISIIIFISWFSHHIRDSNRHGLWFGYDISTPPIKDYQYILLTCLIPLLFRFLNHL